MTDEQLTDHVLGLHQRLTTVKAAFLMGLGEFADRDLHREQGDSTAVAWLSRQCGLRRRTAYEYLRVAGKLREFPLLAAAFLDARISYSQVRLLLRYLTGENEEELVELAVGSTYEGLEKELAGRTRVGSTGKNAAEYLKVVTDEETGDLKIWARLNPARGAEFLAALKIGELASLRNLAGLDEAEKEVLKGADPEQLDQLIGKARESAVNASDNGRGEQLALGEKVAARAPGLSRFGLASFTLLQSLLAVISMVRTTPRSRVRAPGAEVILKVGLGEYPKLIGQSGAEVRQIHRSLLNSTVQVGVVDEKGVPLYLGQRKRTVNTALERAILVQWNAQCATPGCVHTQFLEFHHIVAWAEGGNTDADNLIVLCSACHSMVSAGKLRIAINELDPALIEFRFPDGEVFLSRRRGVPTRSAPKEVSGKAVVVAGDSFDD